jgi:hypothetical protein
VSGLQEQPIRRKAKYPGGRALARVRLVPGDQREKSRRLVEHDSSKPLIEEVRARSIAGSGEVVVIKQLWKLLQPLTPQGALAESPPLIRVIFEAA